MRWRPRSVGGDVVVDLGAAEITDRQRLGVLLEGAAALATLRHQGLDLAGDWKTAGLDTEGRLAGLQAMAENPGSTPQSQLRRLVNQLFGICPIEGKGEARRIVRDLAERWSDDLIPGQPTRIVASILRQAQFLWEPKYSQVRLSLAPEPATGEPLWVAAPGPVQRRFLAATTTLPELHDLIASAAAQGLWEGEYAAADPLQLATEGYWYKAVRVWERQPPKDPKARLEWAGALESLGRFESALQVLAKTRSRGARLLKARCCFHLGRLAATNKWLSSLGRESLSGRELVETAELAIRLAGNQGKPASAESWLTRLLEGAKGSSRPLALLVAAAADWDRQDLESMAARLEAARTVASSSQDGWRWFHVRSLLAMAEGDGAGVVENITVALKLARRRLPRVDAANLWNDLAVGRWQVGDLAGAERACGHAARLLARCEGPRRQLLSLRNLAELRLRRGRLHGVRDILEAALVRNRLDGNVRAAAEDAALWARWELVHGRATAALRTCQEAIETLDESGSDWHHGELQVLAVRALGWLGRSEEARDRLIGIDTETAELEPEERPAPWAHAGDRERALAEVSEGGAGGLWRAVLTGQPIPEAAWRDIEALEPYRVARLVWDLELVSEGAVDAQRLREAAICLRRCGATTLASRLEARSAGPWEAVATFLASPAQDEGAVARLFVEAGCLPARLVLLEGVSETILVEGPRSDEELEAPVGEGVLRLEKSEIDAVARSLFHLVCGRLAGSSGSLGSHTLEASPPRPARIPGLVGESEALLDALENLSRLSKAELPILVLGESGTGKELVAQQIHQLSPRAGGTFVAFNCAAISPQLLPSELFGHVKGAFTGADRDRMGIFETARGGTVFLDEIGDLPLETQGMLLRVLQEREIRRVGESLPRRVDVRVVAATHRGLSEMVGEGRFRRDLYYRLKVAELEIPALRDRAADILPLTRHFLRASRHSASLTKRAAGCLLDHDWPGNVRELKNVLEVAVALADGAPIDREHLQLPSTKPALSDQPVDGESYYHASVKQFRIDLLQTALERSEGNRAEAARQLGLTRQALTYLVRALGISVDRQGKKARTLRLVKPLSEN